MAVSQDNGPCIWMSSAQTSSTHQKIWFEINEQDDQRRILPPELYKLAERGERGEITDPSEIPAEFYESSKKKPAQRPNILHLFKASGFFYVSPQSAALINDFDIAPGFLKPVTLYKSDKTTKLPDGFCVLNIAAKKNAFLPEQSEGAAKPMGDDYDIWRTTVRPDLEVSIFSSSALDGADIWRDERIPSKFFISDRLYQALNAQKLAKDWELTRCPVV